MHSQSRHFHFAAVLLVAVILFASTTSSPVHDNKAIKTGVHDGRDENVAPREKRQCGYYGYYGCYAAKPPIRNQKLDPYRDAVYFSNNGGAW